MRSSVSSLLVTSQTLSPLVLIPASAPARLPRQLNSDHDSIRTRIDVVRHKGRYYQPKHSRRRPPPSPPSRRGG